MLIKSFEGIGIPPRYGFKRLLFSPAANALVVQVQSADTNWRPERLFFRRTASDKYQPVGEPGALYSQEDPVVHASKPLLAYNCLEHKFSIDAQGKERHSGGWDSVRLFDLELGIETVPVSPKTIQLPPGIVRGWIASLVSFSESGLYVQAGLATDESNMEYVLAEIDFGMRRMVRVATLPAVFM
jgi:hypothetical protein